jgi:hypothetical protein
MCVGERICELLADRDRTVHADGPVPQDLRERTPLGQIEHEIQDAFMGARLSQSDHPGWSSRDSTLASERNRRTPPGSGLRRTLIAT